MGPIALVSKEPFAQFNVWYQSAVECDLIPEPETMCLATCTKDGRPSNRMVALKSHDKHGFKFTTSYSSRKGKEITENPNVAANFFWEPLRKCVRIEGIIEKEPRGDFEAFFRSTSTQYQIVKCHSRQSEPIENLSYLEDAVRNMADQSPVTIPETIGGYIIIPHTIEFWQGQPNRIHDRIRFRRPAPRDVLDGVLLHEGDNGWVYERLGP